MRETPKIYVEISPLELNERNLCDKNMIIRIYAMAFLSQNWRMCHSMEFNEINPCISLTFDRMKQTITITIQM